ncbi:hypothetical protein AC249_AIPGENE16785 [Exaiptasia diaphana]|nr:hypothetical protein AC249_AIPGENE16785 [Exaiptasia diaphana]
MVMLKSERQLFVKALDELVICAHSCLWDHQYLPEQLLPQKRGHGNAKERKAAFRESFGRIGDLRSLMPVGSPVLARTATATKETRELLLYAYDDKIISDEEFLLLYNENKSKNLDFPCEKYSKFDHEEMADDECFNEFRLRKRDIPLLADTFTLEQRSVIDGVEGFCMSLLKRLAYPCRYSDMLQ